jgi:4-amino-4-deoxy-L-arabinose transferase-like glycosyltransferase
VLEALRRRENRFWVLLLLVTGAALAWRLVYVVWMRHIDLTGDGFHYHFASVYLTDGKGFVNPLVVDPLGNPTEDALHPPAWTLLLAGANELGMSSIYLHQIVACLVGAATVFMTGLAGREAVGPRVGLIGAALAAVYANVWLYERELLSEPLAMFGVALTIYLSYRFRKRPALTGAMFLGASVALLAMTRAEMVALGPLLVLPLIFGRAGLPWSRRIGWLAVAGLTCVVVISPWPIYNTTRFERFVPLTTGLGTAMAAGNCGPTYEGELLGYYQFGCFAYYGTPPGDTSVAEGYYRHIATDFMRDNLSDVPKVVAARIGRTFNLYRPGQQINLETERGTDVWVIEFGTLMYFALLPFGIAGVVIARRRRVAVYPLLVYPAIVALAVVPTIGSVRYRAPAEIPLVLLAAVTLDHLLRRWPRRERLAPDERLVLDPDESLSGVPGTGEDEGVPVHSTMSPVP